MAAAVGNKRKLLIVNQDSHSNIGSAVGDVDSYRQKISFLELKIASLQKQLRDVESIGISKFAQSLNESSKTEIYCDPFLNMQFQAWRQKETERSENSLHIHPLLLE